MSSGGTTHRTTAHRSAATAGLATLGLLMVACGNQTAGSPSGDPSATSTTPATTAPTTPATPTPERSIPRPPKTPTPVAPPTQRPAPVRLTNGMLLTGADVATADPHRGWRRTTASSSPICGRSSSRGAGVRGSLTRHFTTELDATGSQFLTRYDSPAAAKAAYNSIVATIKACEAFQPAPTHARKLLENRTLALGDATTLLRWYDYPLPSDPGSEDGGFPYAVTRQGTVVSVLAFREMGKGMSVPHFETLTRTAAKRLG
jgi:hypothetical protein